MLARAILPEIRGLIQKRDFATLKDIFEEWHPHDLADAVADMDEGERGIIFRLLSQKKAAKMFKYLDFDVQTLLLKALGKEEVSAILNEMSLMTELLYSKNFPATSSSNSLVCFRRTNVQLPRHS